MANVLKALFVTALTVAPLVVKELVAQNWDWKHFYALYSLVVFVGYWKIVFRPDTRFDAVATPSLDNIFEVTFSQVQRQPGLRFPFRVNVYRPWGIWKLTVLLVVAYSWENNPTDSDHGTRWWGWSGLVGKVKRSGKLAFYKKGDDLTEYRMTKRDKDRTAHLEAVLAIPLRRPSGNRTSGAVTAVLAIDALTPDAANTVENWYKDIVNGNSNDLLEKSALLSLYF